jgi:hypothetical protein
MVDLQSLSALPPAHEYIGLAETSASRQPFAVAFSHVDLP